jgi:hypothetical protein
MPPRWKGCTVAFDPDASAEEVARILAAICQLRGVLSAKSEIADHHHWIAVEQAKASLKGEAP